MVGASTVLVFHATSTRFCCASCMVLILAGLLHVVRVYTSDCICGSVWQGHATAHMRFLSICRYADAKRDPKAALTRNT